MAAAAKAKRQSIDFCRMMERLGIEPAGGVVSRWSLSYATAQHGCQACSCKVACRAWLDSMPTAVNLAPHFCPIADILFEMRVDQSPDAADAHY